MLPARHRMRRRAEFTTAIGRGRRGPAPRLVVHVAADGSADDQHPTVGFVVSRSVGGAVVRNQVKRRLRAQMSSRLDRLPRGSRVVVRALPAAAGTPSAALGEDLDRALGAALRSRRSS